MIPNAMKEHKAVILLIAASVLVIADRAAWASVSQWREDQGLSMWLGAHFLRQATPVGCSTRSAFPIPMALPSLVCFSPFFQVSSP